MADIKAIKGTDGTTYNLRDDYSVWGGNNLLLNVKKTDAPNVYLAAAYNLVEPLVAGERYTLQYWFTNSGRTATCPYVGGGSLNIGSWISINNDSVYYSYTFIPTTNMAAANQFINIYASTTGGTQGSTAISGTFTVLKAKLEKGDKATDWSPCYKDIFTYDSTNSQLVVNL